MDELARVELAKLQGDWDATMDGVADGMFKTRTQLVYIEEMNVNFGKADGRPWISFTVCGAEKDNEKCSGDVLFGLRQSPPKDRDYDMKQMSKFLVALGLPKKVDLGNLDKAIQPIINKVFKAKVEIRKGKQGGEFLNATPMGFVGTEATKESSGEVPF